jgi:hypothetical protein
LPPRRGERTRRSAAEATRRWRVHPTVSAHTGEGLGRPLGLALSAAARRPLVSLAAARERERGRGRMRLGFARGRRARFCSAGNLAQPSDESFPAQAQVAACSAGRAERERAAGLISVSGRMAAWHGECGLRKSGSQAGFGFGPLRGRARGVNSARAGGGPFSIYGPNFAVDSNFS